MAFVPERSNTRGLTIIRLLAPKPHFFGAASEVSTALGNVEVPGSGLLPCRRRTSLLRRYRAIVIDHEQGHNCADRIRRFKRTGLDEILVHKEQSAVQEKLDALYNTSPYSYNNAVTQIMIVASDA